MGAFYSINLIKSRTKNAKIILLKNVNPSQRCSVEIWIFFNCFFWQFVKGYARRIFYLFRSEAS